MRDITLTIYEAIAGEKSWPGCENSNEYISRCREDSSNYINSHYANRDCPVPHNFVGFLGSEYFLV